MKLFFNPEVFVSHPPALLLATVLCAALAGCASIPPEQATLPRQELAGLQLAAGIKLATEGWPEAQWWRRYGDPQLDALIDTALRQAPGMAQAATRIGSAQAALASGRAARDVSVSLEAQANRQRYSGNGLFPAPIGGSYFTSETVQLAARYDFDWWGRQRALIAAALGEVNARRADYAMAEQALAAEVAQSYFALQGGWARLANLQRQLGLQQALLAERKQRIQAGLLTIDARHGAEEQLSKLKLQAALLEADNGHQREALRALLGADAAALGNLTARAALQPPHALPGRLGMDLLARRPDLQAARWRIEASLSRVEAAEAAFYPDIDLSASFGLDAIHLGKLLESGSRTLFVGPALSLPLFDSKRLQASLGAARQQREELVADYNRAVFEVVREVAQAGIELQGVEQQIARQDEALQSGRALLATAAARLRQGLAGRGAGIDAEIALAEQQDIALQLQQRQWSAEVALVRALGGGFRAEAAAPALAATATATK